MSNLNSNITFSFAVLALILFYSEWGIRAILHLKKEKKKNKN
ncbi:hypothetical protein HOLDEFILI_01953 [Holdemania filiformis DSM 12042]|uniref:Uncharacterized protein n=1 Tax=Holdemania filiformis DSM 12042 TaxID=545696 RepID=B9Y808_9FIRM|nr:hypothetical protein HOLDEFILI_01953 [Holdemania filiformis DSM 12042]